jgi:hypothetical protein
MKNNQPKLRGGQKSELTRLKALSPSDRAEIWSWRAEKSAEGVPLTNAAIRTRIVEKFGIALERDGQLSEFWQWQYRQMQFDRLGELASEDEAMLAGKYPNVDRDRLRDVTIKRLYAVADLEQSPAFSLKVVNTDIKDSAERRDWEKFRDTQKNKIDAGLDELAGMLRKYPDLLKEYQGWRAKFTERISAQN